VIGRRYSHPMRCGGPGGRTIAAAAVAVAVLAGCSGGSSDDATLSPINGSAGTVASVTTPSGSGPTPGTALDPASAGSGFVQLQVSIGATGVNETLSLDRATVSKAVLDPATLNATCTPLDGGDTSQGVDVTVVDLRRLASGNQLISAVLHVEGAPEAGEHEATLKLGGKDQKETAYTGTVELAEGGAEGTLEMTDAGGNALTGSFACAAEPLPTTTAVPDTGGDNEAVPGTPAPTAPAGT
jgi:hypothetical protein